MSRLSEDASRRKRVNYTISDDWTSDRGGSKKLRLYALETTVGYVPPQDSVQDKHDQQLVHLSRPQLFTERQHALSPQQRDQYQRQGMDPVVDQPGEILLTSGTSVDAKDETHAMSLHSAIKGGYKEIVPLLLDRGADINAKDRTGSTLLHIALARGQREIAQLLLDRGADVNAESETYDAPLYMASLEGYKDIVQLLLDRGADVNAKSATFYTPLYAASARGYKEIVQLLLDSGADVNAEGLPHRIPLHVASTEGYKEIVQLLLDYGADNNVGFQERVVDFSRNHSGESRSGIHGSRRGHTKTTFSIDHTA
ncbi:hypothetical protein KCU99_g603, partial [Aureobasidium melanogenum]